MSENNKSYRIRTEINSSSPFYLNVNLNQDYKNFEILSLNLDTESLYKMYTSEYGCVVGRVLANDALGIPNAKISVFVPTEESDDIDPILHSLYPYETTLDENDEHIRYNTLPDEIINECHQSVGTFPNKRLVLDDNNILEIFDKYYKYTTVSNASGDYMLYGIPVGQHTIHVDIDLSDIGELSQRPIDMMYKGYDKTQFQSSSMFNKSTDIDKLTQIFSQNHEVYVNPFWGNDEAQDVSITRCDISIQYKFEPTCIFIGSIITDSGHFGFSKKCVPSPEMGEMKQLVGTSGRIEIIRKTQGNNVESLVIQGTQLIDGSGKWCFQIPMNLDFIGTDEYGNRVATNDPNKGIPTRARVRFRISSADENANYSDLHITKILVPHNPKTLKEIDYAFGDKTLDNEEASLSFRDLFKDNVYTVKSYIPRIQKGTSTKTKFSGIKNVTDAEGNNNIPYNNIRVNITFMFTLQCAILKMVLYFIKILNGLFSSKIWYKLWSLLYMFVTGITEADLTKYLTCITVGDGLCPDMEGWYFAPGCEGEKERALEQLGGKFLKWLADKMKKEDNIEGFTGINGQSITPLQRTAIILQQREHFDVFSIDFGNSDDDTSTCVSNNTDHLMQCVEIHLAMEHNVIQFDFYNDWLNGTIYLPKWFGTIKRKRSYFFGLVKRPEKIQACMEDTFNKTRNLTQQCALTYKDNGTGIYNVIDSPLGCKKKLNKGADYKQKCHKKYGRKRVKILGKNGGVVHKEETMRLDYVYYLRPMELYEERLIFLFATDIVLLGSINPNNIYGIPYVFNGLTYSSYKLPSLLATTNLQSDSTQYTACVEDLPFTTSGVTVVNTQDEDSYDETNGIAETIYTEASGIDWGYSGPGQGENNINNLYFPGGHFLGISCSNTETNIKSCVNLSRACEIDTTFSQFIEVPTNIKSNIINYNNYIPNGLISKKEITDSSYRNIFATLNFNGLKTISNKETLQRENEFFCNFSFNFDGLLSKNVDNDSYNAKTNLDKMDGNPSNEIAYNTSFESYDVDYYKFRFGTYRGTYRECFAGQEVNDEKFTVTFLPIYNNSFYFYFGIKNGETAYDKLYNDYYSLCSNTENTIPSIEVSKITNNDFCETSEGTALIEIAQISSVYELYLLYNDGQDDNRQVVLNDFKMEDNIPTISVKNYDGGIPNKKMSVYKKIQFKDLINGNYTVCARMLNDSYEYKATFTISRKSLREDKDISEILDSIVVFNFENGITDPSNRNEDNVKDKGYISLIPNNVIKEFQILYIEGTNKEKICSSDESITGLPGYTHVEKEDGKVTRYKFYVPSGDTRYYVNMIYNCPESSTLETVELKTDYGFTVAYGELPLDYYFTYDLMEGRIIRKLLSDTGSININSLNGVSDWYIDERLRLIPTDENDSHNNDVYSAARLAWLESALIYDTSMFKVLQNKFKADINEKEPETNDAYDAYGAAGDWIMHDGIFVGFSTIPGVNVAYSIYGDEVITSSTETENKLEISPFKLLGDTSESDFDFSKMPVYLPTSRLIAGGDNGELTIDHYFSPYFEKLKDIGYKVKTQNELINMMHDYEMDFTKNVAEEIINEEDEEI